MRDRRQTTKTVSIDIERAEKANAQRIEKITQLQAEIETEKANIKELRKLHDTLYRTEFKEKIARGIGDRKLSDDEMTKLIAITRQIVDNIDSFDINALSGGEIGETSPPIVPLPKPAKIEPKEPEIPPVLFAEEDE